MLLLSSMLPAVTPLPAPAPLLPVIAAISPCSFLFRTAIFSLSLASACSRWEIVRVTKNERWASSSNQFKVYLYISNNVSVFHSFKNDASFMCSLSPNSIWLMLLFDVDVQLKWFGSIIWRRVCIPIYCLWRCATGGDGGVCVGPWNEDRLFISVCLAFDKNRPQVIWASANWQHHTQTTGNISFTTNAIQALRHTFPIVRYCRCCCCVLAHKKAWK